MLMEWEQDYVINYQLSYTNLGMREAFTNNSVRIFLTTPYLGTELSATSESSILALLSDELSSVSVYGAPNLGLKRLKGHSGGLLRSLRFKGYWVRSNLREL